MDQYRRIKNLDRQNFSQSAIARKVGVDRKTVKKYLNSKDPPSYKTRAIPSRSSLIDSFSEAIEVMLKRSPKAAGSDIYELLVEKGYKGSERTVYRHLQQVRSKQSKERFFEQEYQPGEQCQFDFKERIKIPFQNGVNQELNLHFSTLPYSSTFYIKAFPSVTWECFIDGAQSFFEVIDGQPENIRIDNLSPCVKKVLPHGERLYTDAFKRAIDYYNFKVLPCSPGKGNEKGDVERDIRTYARKILSLISLKQIKFRDFNHLNDWLLEFCRKRWKHPEKLKEEQSKLLSPLPRKKEVLCRQKKTTVGKYGTVRLGKSTYSVPDHWIGLQVTVISGPYEVIITRDKKEVTHPRKIDGQHSILLEHTLPSLIRKPQAMIRWRHQGVLLKNKTFKKLYSYLKAKSFFAEIEFLRTLNLCLNHPLGEVKAAIELCMENSSLAKSFNEQVSELLGEHRPVTEAPEQEQININLGQFDQFIGGKTDATRPTCKKSQPLKAI